MACCVAMQHLELSAEYSGFLYALAFSILEGCKRWIVLKPATILLQQLLFAGRNRIDGRLELPSISLVWSLLSGES